ncbi:uncharacterized protein MELLADRAFT_91340 [Melampsora larici-populina 98AG31]|uniref:Ribosomal protein/NADH dehydrogenase domain-containing protein n=1 Tax=Melampsora larici-populina (strain 98AG31 / pathotype 3-4-7) TaxID=747676 RepID=F4RYP8_MELLP|nr:uncharacterized protein MELLADRAFT_91340 [Melampsora larici-populina 98AG31]EGG02508.1 hypothetical protein MELLADRAFT_91340 [Melampsora larici-populina 98AG31]
MASILRSQLPKSVKEIRFQFDSSFKPMNDFIKQTYPKIKSSNPNLPILIRPLNSISEPRCFVRLENGVEKRLGLNLFKSHEEIESNLSNLIQSS